MLGLAQGAYDLTLPYLFERKQFGKLIYILYINIYEIIYLFFFSIMIGQRIGDFQSMQHQYAQRKKINNK